MITNKDETEVVKASVFLLPCIRMKRMVARLVGSAHGKKTIVRETFTFFHFNRLKSFENCVIIVTIS